MGFLNTLLDLKDMNRYCSGQMTNAQIAEVAIKVLVPIPILNDRLAQWLVQNMPDPNGHWHGPVGQVDIEDAPISCPVWEHDARVAVNLIPAGRCTSMSRRANSFLQELAAVDSRSTSATGAAPWHRFAGF